MSVDEVAVFERQVRVVGLRAERALRRGTEPAAAAPIEMPGPEPGTAAHSLALTLTLTDDELDLLWSVVARSVEPSVGATLRAVFGLDARFGVSVAQHVALADLSIERSRNLLALLDPRHRLRRSGILVPVGDPPFDVQTPWTTSYRVCRHLRGDDEIDATVESAGGVIASIPALHSADQRQALARLRAWLNAPAPATIVLEGAHGSGRRTAIALAAAPRRAIAVDFARIAPRNAERILTALRLDGLLLDAVPVLANLDELWARLPPDDEIRNNLVTALDAIDGPLIVTTTTNGLELRAQQRMVVRARWPLPDATTRARLWSQLMPEVLSAADLDLVAHRYEVGAGGIIAAGRSAQHRAEERTDRAPKLEDLVAGVQDNITERLGELAKRVDVTQEWSELVLPPETFDDVRALIGRIRNAHAVLDGWGFRRKLARGAGVAALFSGPPGTGKTMVAGLIARELQLELYQVDLSRIVSKWIGETEKQLAKVFEAAEAGHALLLFDEADALFAKRSAEVKSAVDRYANLEVNYLLQRVESFGGVVILTTNLDTSIDPALRRRLATHIVFGAPEAEERLKLWRAMLDTGAPIHAVDFRELAEEFAAMSGANIRNATLTAAFLAAEEKQPITMTHLRRAARSEYRAMGRVLSRDGRA